MIGSENLQSLASGWLFRIVALLLVGATIAGCGRMPQPFGKEAPLPKADRLVAPPWETMVKAGPGASKDLDLETLNGPQSGAGGASEASVAQEAAQPTKAKPGQSIKAVAVLAVTGNAPAGNAELTSAMRSTLKKAGWPVRNKAGKDTLSISGKVRLGEVRGKVQTVTLAWDVKAPNGKSLGLVSQTNDVPAGSLDQGWGALATPAVEAGATGIFELIDKFR